MSYVHHIACTAFSRPTAVFRFKTFSSSPNRVGNFWGFSLPSFVRRGRGGRGPRQPLRSRLEHPIQIRYHVSSLLSNPVRAFSMAGARSLPRALPHAFAKTLRRASTYSPPTKGRDDQGEASRKPGHFSHGRQTHQPLLQQAFQEITRPNLPTHLGVDPFFMVKLLRRVLKALEL